METCSKTWCPLPWISQSIRNNGDIRLCCHANQSQGRGVLKKEDGASFNAGLDSLNDARNAELVKKVRLDMLEGKWNPACARCESEETAGVRSRRVYEQERWQDNISYDDCVKSTDSEGGINPDVIDLQFADIRFGNLCNLKCRSCGPTDSSKWYEDYTKVWGKKFTETSNKIYIEQVDGKFQANPNVYDWHMSPKFWDQLEQRIPQISQLYLVGGEPLLIKAHFDFLQKCIEEGYAKNIKLEYNSNITVIPDKAWDQWRQFREVQVGASIDGVGKFNDYIRNPSIWSEVEANLDRLDNAEGNFRILLSATIMIYNVLHFPDMMIWKTRKNFKRVNTSKKKALWTPHPLHRPFHLNIQAMPKTAKLFVAEHYEKNCQKLSMKS
jgi:sulfatase maturation enzyme AslB (radical SAM superfamily)